MLLAMLAMPTTLWADNQAYARYNEDGTTLTFFYDEHKQDTDYGIDAYVTNDYNEEVPAWSQDNKVEKITKVVFDASFAEARPTNCSSWFYDMTNLTDIESMKYLNTSKVTSMYGMFCYCVKLAQLDLSHFNTEKVTNMALMFAYCCNLTQLDFSKFNTENVTDMQFMFYGCQNLTKLDLSNFNTAKVTNMQHMFYYCPSLAELDLSNFNTENVTDMQSMFWRCQNLTKLDLSNFNTAKVTNIQSMFYECPSLTELDLYGFDTRAVTYYSLMFSGNTSLQKIFVGDNFTVTDNTKDMFSGCTSLPNYDENKTDGTMANYTDGYLLKKVGTNGDEILGAKGSTLTIESLDLDDDKAFELYESCKATKASYSRSMSSTWGTLCLPYSIDATAEDNTCKFYSLQSVGKESIWLKEIENGAIAAGTPVLVKKNDGQTTIEVKATDADMVKEPVATEGSNRLVGTFSTVVLNGSDNADCFFIAKDKFYKVADYSTGNGVKVSPFRAYLQTTSISCASQLRIDNEANGIDAATIADTLNDSATECYDINGRRTNGIQKGLNIVRLGNGKTMKVFVK